MGQGTLGKVREGLGDSRGTRGEVLNGSGVTLDVRDGLRTLGVVRDRSGDPWGGPGRVGGPSGRSWTGRGTLEEIRDGSGDPRETRG